MKNDDVEEGEIADSDDDGLVTTRDQSASSNPEAHLPPAFRGRLKSSSDSESDSDNNSDTASKRPRLTDPLPESTHPAVDKKSIWSNVLMEQSLTASIQSSSSLHSHKKIVERGPESFVPLRHQGRADKAEKVPSPQPDKDTLWNLYEDGEDHGVKNRLGKRPHDWMTNDGFANYAALRQELPDIINEDDDERTIARYISHHLGEPKVELLHRVARTVGKSKTIDLYNKTQDVSAAGGMKTADGRKNRTLGGIFFQLLKTDKGVTKADMDIIFAIEKENKKLLKKQQERERRKRKYGDNVTISVNTNAATKRQDETTLMESFDLMEEPDIQIGV